MAEPKVTVYITAYNYGKYIDQAVQSVLNQTYRDWELIIIDDGSTDNTREVLEKYTGRDGIKIIYQKNKGLTYTNNVALKESRGDYIIRLDADDYLDENALLVMANVLDGDDELGLVYPDYYEVDEGGEILNIFRRKKIGSEVKLLDLPAHGACTMIRKSSLLTVGGYNEELTRQDGYDFWLKFIDRFKPSNVNLPLFYYRKHGMSLTDDMTKLLRTRRQLKRDFVKQHRDGKIPRVLAIIPAVRKSDVYPEIALKELAGKPLISYSIEQALKSELLDRVVVTTDDDKIIEYASTFEGITAIKRPESISIPHTKITAAVRFVLDELEGEGYIPDAVMLLYITVPMRRAEHIDKAVDTLTIHDTDGVVSVTQEKGFFYYHDKYGMKPLFEERLLKKERETLFRENGAVFLYKRESLKEGEFACRSTGHIVMTEEESIQITSRLDFWIVEKIIKEYS
jgi:CMP-N-acetylneuraminic acid synthetase